jgi:hypothetical protein
MKLRELRARGRTEATRREAPGASRAASTSRQRSHPVPIADALKRFLWPLLQSAARLFLMLAAAVLLVRPIGLGPTSLPTALSWNAPAVLRRADGLGGDGDLSGGVRAVYDDGSSYIVWAVTPLSARWPALLSGPPLAEQLQRLRTLQRSQRYPPRLMPVRNVLRLRL